MNYLKLYDNLCKRGQERVLESYTEKHHVVPRCIGGSDSANNLTELTWREHQLAHKLLTKIYPDNTKLAIAAIRMRATTKEARLAMSKAMTENNPSKGGAWNSGTRGHGVSLRKTAISDAEKKALAERMKKNNPNAQGLVGRKEVKVTCVETGKTFTFSGLAESEREISVMTGKVINHTSVWNNMKKNRPYKGYAWEFNG